MAQQNYCGTDMTAQDYKKIMELQGNNMEPVINKSGQLTYYIPIKFHAIGDNDGVGYHSKRTILTILCELNDDYNYIGFHFYLYGDIHYINSTTYNNGNVSGMFNKHNVDKAVNVYIALDAVSGTNSVCGYYTGGYNDAVVMAKSCAGIGDKTFPHELGHFFYLPHTFSGWEYGGTPSNPEYVDGRNCSTAGDEFCDTDADYLYWRWNCPYTGNIKDPANVTIHPDETLFMSYASDHCVNRFSTEQKSRMIYVVYYYRNELISHPDPDITSVGTTTLISPSDDETDIPQNYIVFEWDSVPGATSYHLVASRFNIYSDTKLALDIITSETSFVALDEDFDLYKNYKWMVKAFTNGNTCASYTNTFSFRTGDAIMPPIGINENEEIQNLVVYPNPLTQGNNLKVQLSSSTTFITDAYIYDVTGKLIYSQEIIGSTNSNNYSLDTGKLPLGIYLLRLEVADQSYQRRFIIAD